MFNESLARPRPEALRLQQEEILHQRLWPDSPPRVLWLRRLASWWQGELPEVVPQPGLPVPDGFAALLVRNGQPVAWLPAGRQLPAPAQGPAEVRLIAVSDLPQEAHFRLELALDLPFERALLFAGGVQVATLRNGSPRRGQVVPRPEPRSVDKSGQRRLPADEGDPDFSFV